jgi:ABC-type lipoprotein export system ATPase subunit
MTYNDNAIQVRDLHKHFLVGGQVLPVLRAIDLNVPSGQFIAIMGPSGSGKSTLLYLIGGLDRPNDGKIAVDGQRLDLMNSDELAHFRSLTVGFVFQSFHLVPTLTALENVALPGIFAHQPREQREARAAHLLNLLKLGDRMDHRPSQLSGGQQQRVAIARALFNDPPIIMCDEPTGALDSQTGQLVMRMLRQLCSRYGKTVVVVTHDPTIAQYADRMVMLRDGVVVDDQALTSPPTPSPLRREGDYADSIGTRRAVSAAENLHNAIPQQDSGSPLSVHGEGI